LIADILTISLINWLYCSIGLQSFCLLPFLNPLSAAQQKRTLNSCVSDFVKFRNFNRNAKKSVQKNTINFFSLNYRLSNKANQDKAGEKFAPCFYRCLSAMTSFGQTRRYPQPKSENSKKIFRFSYSLPNKDLPLLYPLSAICYTLFFRPNAQLRPFIERRSFPAPRLPRRSSKSEGGSSPSRVWDLGVLFWTFKFEKFEFV
jgi:hypothetical protein